MIKKTYLKNKINRTSDKEETKDKKKVRKEKKAEIEERASDQEDQESVSVVRVSKMN